MCQITKFRDNDVFSSEVHRAVQKRHDYGETFNLAQKVVRSAVEADGESLCHFKKILNDWFAKEQRLTNINNNNKEDFNPNQQMWDSWVLCTNLQELEGIVEDI
ncbi:35747_t:CDS:2, partial [Racocetra persica]